MASNQPRESGGVPDGSDLPLFNLARGAKGVALLLFLLPWITVSCAGQTLASISGVDLATGSITLHNPLTGATETPPGGGESDLPVLIAAILIGGALIATFFLRRAAATLAGMAGSATAGALIGYTVLVRVPGKMRESQAKEMRDGFADSPLTDVVGVDVAAGFWLTCAALAAAVILNWMARSRAAP